ncbi:hypothetical protein J2T12_004160 [Paenibacillus anaericanus]|uniref:DUF6147 family protein n=1 Tax=Paenibacillus anaericanus TaxID=170367 RepID=UPI00277DB7E2|nr:DUF6147 family protein [Paenibacillus anaericanus]MDQ0090737.1 hypothetical protein [Paenibacillus anaericanus]
MTNKKIHLKGIMLLGISVLIGLIIPLFNSVPIAASGTTMHTTPPPITFSPYSIFNSSFVSLESGVGSVSKKSSGKVLISGETNAKQTVNTIGVKVVLQRWTGSDWVNYYTGSDSTKSNASFITTSQETTAATGYYYRTKTTHWTVKNGLREEGTLTSDSVAID